MARTGPQKIPGASQQYFFGTGQYSGSDMEVNCGVIHTTEGRTLTTYSNGAVAPTITGVPDIKARKIRWYQHFDVDESARALANKLGGVQTNTANVFQIELVGTCDDKYVKTWGNARAGVDYLHWPTAPDWALAELAWLVRWLNKEHGIPLTARRDWLAYGKDARRPGVTPASYGANPARMSFTEWQNFKGWCGHQHVPENDHGDPGNLDFTRVLELARSGSTSANPPAPRPSTPAPVPTTPAPEEDAVPQVLSKANPADVQLHGDAWTGLAFSGANSAVIHGPGVRHSTSVRLLLDEATLPMEAEIVGRFFLVPVDWKGDVKERSNFLEQSAPTGGPSPVFTCDGDVPAGKSLRFEMRVSEDAKLLHRQATGLYWTT